jgi:hypothetical protein
LVSKGDARSGSRADGFSSRVAGSYNIVNSAGDIVGSVEPSRAKLSTIDPKFSDTVGDVWTAFDTKGNTIAINQNLNNLRSQLKSKKDTTPEATQPAPKAERKPVTATDLKNLGIPKISGAYNLVLGKDLNDPVQRQEVRFALDNYADTGRIKPKTKQKDPRLYRKGGPRCSTCRN